MITFHCPNCGKQFQLGDEFAGRQGKCKNCGMQVLIPPPSAPAPAAPIQYSNPALVYQNPAAYSPANYPAQNSVGGTYQVANQAASGQAASGQAYGGYAPSNIPNPQLYGYAPQPIRPPQPPQPRHPSATPVRFRRLNADLLQMQRAFTNNPLMRVHSVEGNPPERYLIEYRVRGLMRGPQNTPVFRDQHFAEIQLTSEYPRQSPKCRMLTPVFHPNIEPSTICVGDHWTAGERLVDLVVRIAEMIAYQAYNIKSSLDGEAAMWTDHNRQHFPIDRRDMQPPDVP